MHIMHEKQNISQTYSIGTFPLGADECYLTIAQLMTSVIVQINEASKMVHFIYFPF